MAYNAIGGFPQQQLPESRKTKAWRKQCVDWGDDRSLLHYHKARKSVLQMQINYDLLNGKIHMEDLKRMVNPFGIDASFIPDSVQHYPVINSKLNVLVGEEGERLFDWRVVVTNPGAVSEIEEEKNREVNMRLQKLIADDSINDEQFQRNLEKLSDYFQYEWQDKREARANQLLAHYIKELDVRTKFNQGLVDAEVAGEEMYQFDIVGGEPVMWKLDPRKVRVIKSGSSDRIEDADIIVIEDYWSPGRIIDVFHDQLQKEDVKKLENAPDNSNAPYADEMGNIDPRYGFVPNTRVLFGDGASPIDPMTLFGEDADDGFLPYDMHGNVRVLQVYWKSRRKIKKVKSYDPETGEEQYDIRPEDYIIDPAKGEEEQTLWINEAWEGTKIGSDIYVNMRPRPIQYNTMSNPSRCHFGIIGSIYNRNGDEPFSMVDMVKPYAYAYDVYHDELRRLLARNVGKVVRMDFAKVPKGWDADKWIYYMKVNGIAVEDSFKEGDYGAATNKLAGGLNNASSGVIDASLGNEIAQYIQLLTWIDGQIGSMLGISKQREGQVSNRETVGGVERATLQSSHITKWIFTTHENLKKRCLECLLETAKIAMRGGKKKFKYILSDGAEKMMEIDGDEFAECDYGLVVDNSNGAQELNQKLETLAQAALQNQLLDFSTLMKIYTTQSLAEKQRMVEACERKIYERQAQQQQQQLQMQQQQIQANLQAQREKAEMEYKMHQEDNETKILVAQINASAEDKRYGMMQNDTADANARSDRKIDEQIRQFDAKMENEKAKLELGRKKQDDDARIREKQLSMSARGRQD